MTKSTEPKLLSQTLHELTEDARQVENIILQNEGELTEVTEQLKAVIDGKIVSKTDSIGFVLDRLKGVQEYLAGNAEMFYKKAEAAENALNYLKDYIKGTMLTLDRKKIDGNFFVFSLGPSKPRVEVNELYLPKKYFKSKLVETPDKDLIREALEAGLEVPGARLIEGHTLRKTVQTKKNKIERIE